jgi:hypothetical protein
VRLSFRKDVLLLTYLIEGQEATVLQLPATAVRPKLPQPLTYVVVAPGAFVAVLRNHAEIVRADFNRSFVPDGPRSGSTQIWTARLHDCQRRIARRLAKPATKMPAEYLSPFGRN